MKSPFGLEPNYNRMALINGICVVEIEMARRHIPKGAAKNIAAERIDILFSLVEEETKKGRPARAKRYLDLAMRIGMRYNVSISHRKRTFCPECKSLYQFPKNAIIRLKRGHIIVTCRNCGHISRYPYKS